MLQRWAVFVFMRCYFITNGWTNVKSVLVDSIGDSWRWSKVIISWVLLTHARTHTQHPLNLGMRRQKKINIRAHEKWKNDCDWEMHKSQSETEWNQMKRYILSSARLIHSDSTCEIQSGLCDSSEFNRRYRQLSWNKAWNMNRSVVSFICSFIRVCIIICMHTWAPPVRYHFSPHTLCLLPFARPKLSRIWPILAVTDKGDEAPAVPLSTFIISLCHIFSALPLTAKWRRESKTDAECLRALFNIPM